MDYAAFASILEGELRGAERIIIAGHINPDGDAVGSCFALALALNLSGKAPVVLLERYSEKFNYLRGGEFVYSGDYKALTGDAFIALDCSAKDRLGEAMDVFDRIPLTFNIDHHISNPGYAVHNCVRPDAAATCEVIYRLIGGLPVVDRDVASALYTGIVTDTGVFRHNSTSPETMEAAAALMRLGVDFCDIQRRVIYLRTTVELNAATRAHERVVLEGNIAHAYVTMADLEELGAGYTDLDGIVESLLNIEGVECAVFFTERPNGVKASFRSLKLNVNKVAGVFGGGGHLNASGATIAAGLAEAVPAVLTEIREAMKEMETNG